ncbi:hypothetical protein M413DRAFT_31087 [Hebeloma cylindrosporum]|uniref:C2H2-type domain-containing protein n=1 Tax=Hebeloma cylindrosporum TaxID=76867 RepID=A0A0C2XH21_HEBCY|nr:hypothetical protein M413DRAFT_31087 [Hebeloma cylindrosporum h7]
MNNLLKFKCPFASGGCSARFRSQAGRTNHVRTFHTNHNIVDDTEDRQPKSSQPRPAAHPDIIPEFDAYFPEDLFTEDQGLPAPDIPHADAEPQPRTANSVPRSTHRRIYHPHLTGRPCDKDGNYLAPGTPPSAQLGDSPTSWDPFDDELQFRLGDFLYRKVEMSGGNIDELMDIWTSTKTDAEDFSLFESHEHMYATIDAITHGNAPWKTFTTSYAGEIGPNPPSWQLHDYQVCFRDPSLVAKNMLDNPDFDQQIDYAPYVELDALEQRCWISWLKRYDPYQRGHRNAVVPIGFLAIPKSDRKYDDDIAFRKFKRQLYHASLMAILKPLHAAMTTPVVLRCPDGHYRWVIFDLAAFIADYPEQVYLAGTVQGWCPRCTALPDDLDGLRGLRTREFTKRLLETLDSKMLWFEYGIDEEILPFTHHFPRADIHEMLTPDLLHQLIKGTFKDHLVLWIADYLVLEHGEARANDILDDIDRRIAAAPLFPNLHRFPHGRRFKQWTGDDSKALMKVYLSAITGHVPQEMVQAISAFLDVCYLARRSDLTEATLKLFDIALARFYEYREIFCMTGVRPKGFSLPRQHSLSHYRHLIQEFGAPNGICSSITESRHITAVKKPWRRSNRYEALQQMLLTNQRLDKLHAARVDFIARGMLPPEVAKPKASVHVLRGDNSSEDDEGGNVDGLGTRRHVEVVEGNVVLARTRVRNYPRTLNALAAHVNQPRLVELTRRFLHDQLHPDGPSSDNLDLDECPDITGKVSVFHSAVATFFAPSDECGLRGMCCERIRSCPSWRKKAPRRDCAFVVEDEDKPGMRGMNVARVQLFFSFM